MKINQDEIINTIKILLYKKNPSLLEKIDFDDDNVFLEPLLFAYFNIQNRNELDVKILEEIMQGYFMNSMKEVILNNTFNKNGIAYIPKLGYYKKNEKQPFEPIEYIKDTNIEILKYSIKVLEHIYRNPNDEQIEVGQIEVENTYEKNIGFLTNAFRLIKENAKEQFDLIVQCCKSCVIFSTNPKNTNSFAAISAHGIAFFNAYQNDYDEVFFIDDIAHQTAHVILTSLMYVRKKIFKTDENQSIKTILGVTTENRTFETVYHAHYTYYAIFTCLENCLKNNVFNVKQEKEAVARIGFYIKKCQFDLDHIEKVVQYYGGVEKVFTNEGIEIHSMIKDKYFDMLKNWGAKTSFFNYKNQPYNFTYSNFLIDNSIVLN